MDKKEDVSCGLLNLHHLLGKKWTYGLLFNIDEEPINFTSIEKMTGSHINPTLLSNRLKELVSYNILKREQVENNVFYSVSEKGIKLKAILHELKLVAEELSCDMPVQCKGRDCAGCFSFRAKK